MKYKIAHSLKEIEPAAWNALAGDDNPFIQYDFLYALETGDCLDRFGWYPRYLLVTSDTDELIGASPAYIKSNSYGELVFDWAWADAYERSGLSYYPKLVVAIPYTPATGPRLLAKDNNADVKRALVSFAIELARQEKLSSVHWLFNDAQDTNIEAEMGLLQRFDYQFHWHNHNYRNFDDFLATLNSKKRKNIKRERRRVKEAGIDIRIYHGDELDEQQWQQVYSFYTITYMKKYGHATLSLAFFKAIASRVLAILAWDGERPVAGAICILGKDILYGRHWGCYEDYDSLHFEVCYYTGIDYCIQHGIQTFEPGAQGEHKIARGFLPTRTWSSHWIADERFRQIIQDHVKREANAMEDYGEELHQASPYKDG